MDQAKYEAKKATHLAKDKLKRQKKMGRSGYLARKITVRRKYFKQKRKAADRNFEAQKQAKINREHGRWNRKSAKWDAKVTRRDNKWDHRVAHFNARMAKRFE